MNKYTCPLCGKKFTEEQAKTSCDVSYPGKCSACELLCCPNCGYKIPKTSHLVDWFSRIFQGKQEQNQKTGEKKDEK